MSESSEESSTPEADHTILACPKCRENVEVPPESLGQLVNCPHCAQPFFAAPELAEMEIVDDTEPEAVEASEVENVELNSERIRQLAALRRSLYRGRSYCIVFLIVCVVTGIQLIWNTVYALKETGWGAKPIGYICCAIAAMIAAAWLFNRAKSIQQEIRSLHHPDEPTTPPDFSSLNDGSQRWKNLDDMTKR